MPFWAWLRSCSNRAVLVAEPRDETGWITMPRSLGPVQPDAAFGGRTRADSYPLNGIHCAIHHTVFVAMLSA
jgi:hypothetical protein